MYPYLRIFDVYIVKQSFVSAKPLLNPFHSRGMSFRNPGFSLLVSRSAGPTPELVSQALPASANPANALGGVADNKRVVGDVAVDDGACAYESVLTDCYSADDRGVRTQSNTPFHQGGADLIHLGNLCSWVIDVRKNHGWPAEHTVFQPYAFVDADIVLNLALITNRDIGTDDNVLSDIAVLAYLRSGTNMGEMPDFCTLADRGLIVDDCGRMNKVVFAGLRIDHVAGRSGGIFLFFERLLASFEDFQNP